MNLLKISSTASICVVIMWLLNPSLTSHRPVAAKHIRNYLFENYNKWYVPNVMIDKCAQQLAGQLERESYIVFSITRLREPAVLLGIELPIDTLTSIGFLGMVF